MNTSPADARSSSNADFDAGSRAGVRKLAEQIIAKGSKSFALASRLLPPQVRLDAWLLYSWCRYADDAIDERPPHERAAALARLRDEVEALYGTRVLKDPLWEALREVLSRRKVPQAYLSTLLDGMQMDVEGHTYQTVGDLLLYCHRVAGVVGLMMAHLLGVSDKSALRHAAELGLGMQLTNICRDVLEDWHLGRLYLPSDLLAKQGILGLHETLGAPLPRKYAGELTAVVSALLDLAEGFYQSSERGLCALDFRSALAIRTARLVYSEIGRVVEDRQCNVFRGRAVVTNRRKLELVAKSLGLSVLDAKRRLREPHVEVDIDRALRFPEDILP